TLKLGASGDIFLTYSFQGSTDVGCGAVSPGPGTYALLAKLDSTGQCLWNKAFPLGYFDFALTPLEDVVISGNFSGTVDLGGGPLVSSGILDMAIARFHPSGNYLSSERYGGPGATLAPAPIAVDQTGGSVVIGYLTGTVDLGCGALSSSPGVSDVFIASF